jgi:hypothetical protein
MNNRVSSRAYNFVVENQEGKVPAAGSTASGERQVNGSPNLEPYEAEPSAVVIRVIFGVIVGGSFLAGLVGAGRLRWRHD